jgi:hypothetical protein
VGMIVKKFAIHQDHVFHQNKSSSQTAVEIDAENLESFVNIVA